MAAHIARGRFIKASEGYSGRRKVNMSHAFMDDYENGVDPKELQTANGTGSHADGHISPSRKIVL